jgi:hypothetical protein
MLGQERSDPAHEGAGEIGAAPSVKALDPAQEAGDERADDRIQKNLCAAPLGHQRMIRKSGRRFSEKIMRRQKSMIRKSGRRFSEKIMRHQKYRSARRIRTRR